MRLSIIGALSALTALTTAQDGLPSCAKTCLTQYTSGSSIAGCTALDIACICSSSSFLSGIACCLAGACDATDQASAVAYAKQICQTAGVTVPDAVVCSSSSTAGSSSTSSSSIGSSSVASSTGSQSSQTSATSSSPAQKATSAVSSVASSATSSTAAAATKNAAFQNTVGSGLSLVGGFAAALVIL